LQLADAVDAIEFAEPVAYVYNPLRYAWRGHEAYVQQFLPQRAHAVFLGMNPGPFGMAQTGVPFGEIASVRDWMQLSFTVDQPANVHPSRLIDGLACKRSEVSGARLWGLFRDRFDSPAAFFANHFVLNYCPLVFMESSGRNRTPDKLGAAERKALYDACDRHLHDVVAILQPTWIVGVGAFAQERAAAVVGDRAKLARILHPSPASPASNKDWPGTVTEQLRAAGVWS
jgi:single-strand selective monofunctional uracil DNA glycosylase